MTVIVDEEREATRPPVQPEEKWNEIRATPLPLALLSARLETGQ